MESDGASSTGVLATALLWLLLVVVVLLVVGVSARLMRARATQRFNAHRAPGEPRVDAWQEAGRRLRDDSQQRGSSQ